VKSSLFLIVKDMFGRNFESDSVNTFSISLIKLSLFWSYFFADFYNNPWWQRPLILDLFVSKYLKELIFLNFWYSDEKKIKIKIPYKLCFLNIFTTLAVSLLEHFLVIRLRKKIKITKNKKKLWKGPNLESNIKMSLAIHNPHYL
jgi:hypothetical protein